MIHDFNRFKKITFEFFGAGFGIIGVVVFNDRLLSKTLQRMLDQIGNTITVSSRDRLGLTQTKLMTLSNGATVRHPFGFVHTQHRALTQFAKQASNIMIVRI